MNSPPERPTAADYHQRRTRLLRLVSMGCDANFADAEAAELEHLVGSDPRLVREYVEAVTTESLLQQTCGLSPLAPTGAHPESGQSQGESSSRLIASELASSPPRNAMRASPSRPAVIRPARSPRHPRSWSFGWLSLAASVAAVAAVATLLTGRPAARIVASTDAWLVGGEAPLVGGRVGGSWMELDSGTLEVAFSDGAMMSVTGPAKLRALGGGIAEMSRGVAHFYVPQGAGEFVVETPGGNVVDLGTSFRVAINSDAESSVHVTTGRVRLDSKIGTTIDLRAGQRANLSAAGAIEAVAPANPRVSGNFEFVAEHPLSLGYNAYDRDGVARVFLERSGLRLGHEVRLDLAESGRHTQLHGSSAVAPEGTEVDVYLVHCAPASMRHEVRGAIRFPGKIIGVICGSDRLNATNSELGTHWTLQCGHPERGMESAPDPNSDEITISPDRQILTAYFRTMSIDQMRVLVAAD